MKKICILLSSFISPFVFGQDVTNEIKKDFNDWSNLISKKEIGIAIDNYANPKIFELMPREQFKNIMESVFKNPNIEFKIAKPIFLKFEEIKKINEINYVKFYITSPIEIKLKDFELSKENISQMITNYELKFGNGKVVFDYETGFFKINAEKIIIANADDKLQEWRFVVIDNPRMKELLQKILPSQLFD